MPSWRFIGDNDKVQFQTCVEQSNHHRKFIIQESIGVENSGSNVQTAIENNNNGNEVVVFDEDFVREGSKKCNLTVCGYFMGCDMGINELRYNIRRMWGKFGIRDIISDDNNHEDGMNNVLEQSPWLINGKPLVVQKWDPDMNIVKSEPKSIPMWVKMYNVPLEAWNVKGISSIASRVGKPVMMHQVTANMCHSGVARLGYARVLVEIDAENGYTDKIEIIYRDADKNVKRSFWPWFKECKKRTKSAEEVEKDKHQSNKEFGFGRVRNKGAQSMQGQERNEKSVNMVYRPKEKRNNVNEERDNESETVWNDPSFDKRLIVDIFLKRKQQPTPNDTKNLSYDMINYFKNQWEALERKGNDSDEEEDVIEVNYKATSNLVADEIKG
ncbi:RNA-directed DNA polymerase, eukaryota, reverse transcriptase zinc-binding domain protein [Tanacetum coccineum]